MRIVVVAALSLLFSSSLAVADPDSSDVGYLTCSVEPDPPEVANPEDIRIYTCGTVAGEQAEWYAHDYDKNVVGIVRDISVHIVATKAPDRMTITTKASWRNDLGGTQRGEQHLDFTPALSDGAPTADPLTRHVIDRAHCTYKGFEVQSNTTQVVNGTWSLVFSRLNFEVSKVSGTQSDC